MSLSEHDLETLEVWLDGELSNDQAEALRQRLSIEPELAQIADRLRSDRQVRSGIWQAMEPLDTEVDALVNNVRRGVRRDDVWAIRFRTLRNVSGIAASIAIIFMAGWVSSRRLQFAAPQESGASAASGQIALSSKGASSNSATSGIPGSARLVSTDQPRATNPPPFVLTPSAGGLSSNPVAPTGMTPRYQVYVRNPFGRIYEWRLDELDDLAKLPSQIAALERTQQLNLQPPRSPDGVLVNELQPRQ